MCMKVSNLLEQISNLYFFISLLIFSFLVKPGNEFSTNIDIPHIMVDFTILIPIFLLGVVIFVFLLFSNRIRFDLLSLALFVRVLLPFIPMIYNPQVVDFSGNIGILATAAIVYLIALNTVQHFECLKKYLIFIFLLFCIQTAMESYLGIYSFFDNTYMYKNDLILPIGGSNAIASNIIPLGCLVYCTENKKRNKIVYAIIMLGAVVLTKSRSGIIVSLLMIAVMEAWKRRFSIKTAISLIFTSVIVFLCGIYFIMNTDIGNSAFTQNDSTIIDRFFLLNHGLNIFLVHPILGSGFTEQVVRYNPHNYILYTLMAFGVVGLILFLFIVLKILRRFFEYSSDSYIRGTACFVICLLVQGLGEIVIYAPIIEFMTWFIIGVALRRVKNFENMNGENNGRCPNA